MRKSTYVNSGLVVLLLLLSIQIFAQNYVPFAPRFNQDLKGDIVLIGNNILGPDNNAFNDNTVYNHNVDMRYIDIDSDPTTFSSSSADLVIANPGCYRIIHAGLYWGAVNSGSEPITNVKLKGPSGGYNDITGTIVFDANGTSVDAGDSFPYACYADVTNIVTSLAVNLGTYTIANVSSAEGETGALTPRNGTGHSAGWSLFIVYEDPTLPGKSITSFDGFSAISVPGGNPSLDIPVSGFRTVPAPAPVRANFAFATLEGDSPILGDQLLLNGVNLSTTDRPATNFFNSSVTQLNATPVNNRNPNSTNTLGFDTGVMVVPNPGNSVIANNATSGTVRLETSGDTFFPYFYALAVDIIQPNIVLTKVVEDLSGNDIGGQSVNLGDQLNYVIGFQNNGNDNATNLIIRDILPTNIIFNYPTDIEMLPPGVTVQSYNPTTRELIFAVDNSVVEVNDPVQEIRFKVTVVTTCSLLSNACSNIISNQAFSTYNGTLNPSFTISDDPSFSSNTGCLLTPAATNFLADINCTFNEQVILCGASTILSAADGYDTYSWSRNPSGTPVIGTTQSITVTEPGMYYSANTAIAPCQSIEQEFEVITFGANVTNPVIPFADEVVVCPNDGKELPNFYLCGANDSRLIQTGITDTTSIIWERLDESSCTAVVDQDCANEDLSCAWIEEGTGSDFTIINSGQYRLTLNYTGGCFNRFYFNAFTNELMPTVTSRDIICTTPGEIVVGGVPSGYEYSIDGVNYQTSNTFPINIPNIYSVYVRQIGVTPNPCIFSVPDIQIRERDFTVSNIVTQPFCNGELGSVIVGANDARPQYFYSIYDGATLVNSVGPIVESDYTFENLSPGIYTINVSTEDGCTFTGDIEIIDPPTLTATSALTKPLTCTNGEITVYPEGGTAPYFYYVNSTTVFQTSPIIDVATAGTFNITVVDSNNCSTDTSIIVNPTPAPEFTISKTDILCADAVNSGSIDVNVSNPNGNTLEYSIDNGVTFSNSPVFNGLTAGDYEVVVQYALGSDVCTSDPQTITINIASTISGTATLTTPYTCITNGVITVSGVSGGTAPYTYSIDGINFQTGLIFNGLTNGTYNVTIRDAGGCTFLTAPITIDPLNPLTDLTFSNTPLSCPAITSDVTLTATGGTLPLQYQIILPAASATGYQSSNTFLGLSPDTYTFRVRDTNDCVYSESFTIAPLVPLTVTTVITKDLDCTASPDGIITGNISGGNAPYTYQVDFDGGGYGSSTAITGTSFSHPAPADGTYQFLITDASGCTVESGIQTINPLVAVTASNTVNNPTCNGFSDGSIRLNALTGQAPFTYSIDGGTTFVSSNVFGGLVAGSYDYVVRDSKSCEVDGTVSLSDPLIIDAAISIVSVQCLADVNIPGSLIATINSGGEAPFTYTLFDNSFTQIGPAVNTVLTTNTFSGLSFGDYYVSIVDSNGCEYRSDRQRIDTPPTFVVDAFPSSGTCATGATIDVSVTGTSSYIYSIIGQPTFTFGPTASTMHTFFGLDHGVTYQVQVEDAGGCISVEEAETPILSPIAIDPISNTNVSCYGVNSATASFTVIDYHASVTTLYYEVRDELTNTSITPAINGTLTTVGLAGAPVSTTITGLSAGNYTLFVREDDGTLCTTSRTFQVTQPIQPLISAVSAKENANCNVGAQVTVTTSGGTGPYSYAVGAPGFTPSTGDFGTSNVLNLDYAVSTTWEIVVRDANGCEVTLNETIDIDPEPIITATLNNQCTVTEGNFEIDVVLVTAGITPYTYSIDGGAFQTGTAPFTITNLASGTHTFEVQDANGCGNLVSVVIEAPIDLIPDVSALPTCNDNDGEITITGSGGSGTYTYSISPNPASISLTGNVFSGVPSGTYTVTITDATTTCFENVSVFVPAAIPVSFTTTTTPITCIGDPGTIGINITGVYNGPYNYEIFDSLGASVTTGTGNSTITNPEIVTGLTGGNYTVVVTETASPFCSTTSGIITIPSPLDPLTLIATETSNVTCDNDKGTITAVANGGWGSYEYELTGAATVAYSPNGTFTNLSAGAYTVNVRDAGNCIVSEAVLLEIPQPINGMVSASIPTLSCFEDDNATITVSSVTGGQGSNFTYTLNMIAPTVSSSGPQTTPVFNNLGAGVYNVVVTDGYNCSFNSPNVTINEPAQVVASLVKETTQTCLTNSTLTLSARGGTGSYTFSDTASFATVLGSFTNSVTLSVSPGTYQYYVRDANGCIAFVTNEITIDPLPSLTINLDVANATINCAGDNTGVIIATAQGGLGNYVYTLQDTSGNDITPVTQDSPGVFTNLVAGNYQIRVDSGDCLVTSAQIPITEPSAPLTASFDPTGITCVGTNNGRLEITASGGTGIIKYAISPRLDQFFDSPVFEDLEPGTYQALVQDELGCFVISDFTINDATPVVLNIVPNSIMLAPCVDDFDGEFSVSISGGNLPYSVSLDHIDGVYTTGTATQTEFDFTGLEGGDHTVYVRDNLGCESEWVITFPESVNIDATLDIAYCTDNTDATSNLVTVTVDETLVDITDLDFALDGGVFKLENTFIDLTPGDHFITVRHTNTCEVVINFEIDQLDPLQLSIADGSANEIIASATGGSGVYTYEVQSEFSSSSEPYGDTNTFVIYESANYTVTVTDSNGCVATATRFFEFIDICIPNYFVPENEGWGPNCTNEYRNITFDIFDRYGRKVARLNVDEKWDGKYNGKELPSGDYWYVVKLNEQKDNREFVGHFTLYR